MPTLVLGIGLLVLVGVGATLSVQWLMGRGLIQDFSGRLISRGLATEEMALRQHLDAARHQAHFVTAAIRDGRYRLSDPTLGDFLVGSLAAAPQIDGLVLADRDGAAWQVDRDALGDTFQLRRLTVADDPQLAGIADEIRARDTAYWGPPIYVAAKQTTYLSYRVQIRSQDNYLGFLVVAISTRALSALAASLSDPPYVTAFMLYGSDGVLAHPLLAEGASAGSKDASLPSLEEFGDLVIADFPDLPSLDAAGFTPPAGTSARTVSIGGQRYYIFARQVAGYGDRPIVVGAYNLASAVDAPLKMFYWAMIVAMSVLGLSLLVAAIIGVTIARPVRRAARGAAVVGALDFDKVSPLSGSYLREINELARSFNSMLDGLKAFGRYVPRTLVTRLVKEGQAGAGTEERDLAIMFTDIADFTAACENKSAVEVASFINEHLALIAECVEGENGTIDKYIGDAVMAFWGAPGHIDNPAESACRAALAIGRAIAADNAARAARGLEPVHIRIGIHLGSVVVGDIGAPNRINYTIVGDAVNTAQRLEALGKAIDPVAESIVLISGRVADRLSPSYALADRGAHVLRGKSGAVRVYRLLDAEPV